MDTGVCVGRAGRGRGRRGPGQIEAPAHAWRTVVLVCGHFTNQLDFLLTKKKKTNQLDGRVGSFVTDNGLGVTRTDVDEGVLRPANGGATDAMRCCPALAPPPRPERSNERAAWQSSSSPKGRGSGGTMTATRARGQIGLVAANQGGHGQGHGARGRAPDQVGKPSRCCAARPASGNPRWELRLRHLFVWPRTRAKTDGRTDGRAGVWQGMKSVLRRGAHTAV